MKLSIKILFITFFLLSIPLQSFSQNFGAVLGYSSSKAFFGGGHLIHGNFLYRFTVSFESSTAKGKEVSEQEPNYGKTIEGTGDYFTSYDLGVGYFITPKITLTGEISFGNKKYYTNYIDNRFTDGGYHMIDRDESEVGFGLCAGYIFEKGIGLLVGYNTLREFTFGITMDFSL